jgi:transposase
MYFSGWFWEKLGMETIGNQANYSTDLNDLEWAVMEKILGGSPKLGRPPRFNRRAVLGAIFYMVRTGGSWRLLPHDLPPWRIVYYYFARWRAEGLFEKLHDALREAARQQSGKKKPRRPRFWIAKACARLAEAECAAMMRARRSWDANVISWWIPMA